MEVGRKQRGRTDETQGHFESVCRLKKKRTERQKEQKIQDRCFLTWLLDRPGPAYPYSIHNIAHMGTLFKKVFFFVVLFLQSCFHFLALFFCKSVGEWFGPSVIANVLKLLVRKYSTYGFTFYLASERVLYRENVTMLCRSTPKHEGYYAKALLFFFFFFLTILP